MIVEQSKRDGLTKLADNRGDSSRAVLQDMEVWWREWGPRIVKDVGRVGWVLFLLDAQEKLLEAQMVASAVLRNEGCENIEAVTLKVLRWYENHAEAVKKDAPEWAQFLITAQYNTACVLARLGRELRAKQEQGYSTVVLEHTEGGGIECTRGGDKFLAEVA
jgi:hypothetical protein